MSVKKIAVLLKEGFEEVEAIVPIDVLRRLGMDVVIAGDSGGVPGAHGVMIDTDLLLEDVDVATLSCVLLPGGMPGATNLRDDPAVIELVKAVHFAGGIVAAICAAPIAFAAAGIMGGKRCTGYPMPLVKESLADADYTGAPSEIDGNIVTGKGPGAAFDFALAVATALGAESQTRTLYENMFVKCV